jgi:multiple sugar transport system substrate-binding protein
MRYAIAVRQLLVGALILFVGIVPSGMAQAQETTLTLWSMGGDQTGWVTWLEAISNNFEKHNPGAKVKISFYDKNALRVALQTALRARKGPDLIYFEPDQRDLVEAGYLKPLDEIVPWDKIQPWAREAWTINGHAWGIPYSYYTNEIMYNKKLMAELGVKLPSNGQVDQAQFLDLIEKANAAGMEPMVIGTGDRPFPGAYLTFEMLLRKLGPEDYRKLLEGQLSYDDPRVVAVLRYAKEIVDLGALPKVFATMSLTDSYQYFFNRRGLMFPQGTWYTQRAFKTPDKGGQPEGFEIGIMNWPAMDDGACNNCRTLALSGGYGINADTKYTDLAVAFLKEMATPEMGALWTSLNHSPSGALYDPAKVTSQYASYFKDLETVRAGSRYFVGIPLNFLTGQCRETFVQVINKGLPAGLISVDDTIRQMNQACYGR